MPSLASQRFGGQGEAGRCQGLYAPPTSRVDRCNNKGSKDNYLPTKWHSYRVVEISLAKLLYITIDTLADLPILRRL